MSKESIQGPLSALRNAGTVCGVCLARGPEILVNLFPFSEARINDMVSAIDDIQQFFVRKGRNIDQMSFGYDGGCICVVEDDEFRLIVMHMLADEVDFIAKASRAFLADFHLDLFAEQIASGNTRLEGVVKGNDPPSALMENDEEVGDSPLDAIRRKEEAAGKISEDSEAGSEAVSEEEKTEEASESDNEATESVEMIDLDEIADGSEEENSGEDSSEESEGETSSDSEESGEPHIGVHLSENQPDSTLPEPRRPNLDLD